VKKSSEYIQQATQNTELAAHLRQDKTRYLDWATTCLFYAAVHYVNAYLMKAGKAIPRRHKTQGSLLGRSNIVESDPTLKKIYPAYRHLDDESRDARYELKKPTPEDYDTYLVPQLHKIKDFVMPKVEA
jgi:HEPN domain-containing protein